MRLIMKVKGRVARMDFTIKRDNRSFAYEIAASAYDSNVRQSEYGVNVFYRFEKAYKAYENLPIPCWWWGLGKSNVSL